MMPGAHCHAFQIELCADVERRHCGLVNNKRQDARFLVDAHRAIAVLPSAKLRVGFTALISSLLEDLPN